MQKAANAREKVTSPIGDVLSARRDFSGKDLLI